MIEKCKNIEYIHIIQQQKRYKKDIAWFDSRQPHHVGAKSALLRRLFMPTAQKDVIRPLPCFSFPNRTHCVGLWFGAALWAAIFVSEKISALTVFCTLYAPESLRWKDSGVLLFFWKPFWVFLRILLSLWNQRLHHRLFIQFRICDIIVPSARDLRRPSGQWSR